MINPLGSNVGPVSYFGAGGALFATGVNTVMNVLRSVFKSNHALAGGAVQVAKGATFRCVGTSALVQALTSQNAVLLIRSF